MKRIIRDLGYVVFANLASNQRRSREMNAVPEGRYCTNRRVRLVALCACTMLFGAAARADESGIRQPNEGTASQADQKVEALLKKIERQITVGHTIAPEDDNALATWRVIQNETLLKSPAIQKALGGFVSQARSRAAEEQAAARPLVASDLLVFADRAAELLQDKSAPSASSAVAPPIAPASGLPQTAKQATQPSEKPNGAVQLAALTKPSPREDDHAQAEEISSGSVVSDASTRLILPDTAAVPRTPAAGNTEAAPVVAASRSAVTVPAAKEPSAAAIAKRGDAMLALQDISAAREFYEYAASAGNAHAAAALAETYDPVFLDRIGAVGTRPDSAKAADWYRKAAALGNQDAEARLQTLGAEAAAPQPNNR